MQNLECHSMGENTSEVVCTGDSGEQIEHCNETHKNGLSFILSKLQICRLITRWLQIKSLTFCIRWIGYFWISSKTLRGNIAARVDHSFIIVLGIVHGCLNCSGHLGICTRYFAASLVAVTLNYRSVTNTIYMYLLITFIYFFSFLQPTTKLGQGYVFTRVCDSVHRGIGLCPAGGVSVWGSLCHGDPPTVMSGRYASYWNAFLLLNTNISTDKLLLCLTFLKYKVNIDMLMTCELLGNNLTLWHLYI